MTTKKAVVIILSIIAALVLLVVLFVGAVVGFAFYTLGNSQAATTAKAFLRNNEVLRQDIGQVKDFGSIITGSINSKNLDGAASLNLKVIGEKKTVNAEVDMAYRDGKAWRVVDASYVKDDGQTVDLVNRSAPAEPEESPRE
jgi:hypothetical protein